MLTKKDAIAVGKAVIRSEQKELQFYSCITGTLNDEKSTTISGLTCTVLKELWYDVLSEKVKKEFDYDCQKFMAECCKV